MGIVNIGRIAAVVLLSIAGAACNRSPQSKELSALENAYKSGVLTKAEYEGKRAALETQSSALTALDKALEAGVVTWDEYQARKAQWIAKAGALAAWREPATRACSPRTSILPSGRRSWRRTQRLQPLYRVRKWHRRLPSPRRLSPRQPAPGTSLAWLTRRALHRFPLNQPAPWPKRNLNSHRHHSPNRNPAPPPAREGSRHPRPLPPLKAMSCA